jgi:hypothetical protein
MSHRTVLLLAFLLFGTLSYRCNVPEEAIVNPPAVTNLIPNSSFEDNGAPWLGGWEIPSGTLLDTVRDAPPGGGTWSVELECNGNLYDASRIQFPTAPPPGIRTIYRLSFYAKYVVNGGFASLALIKDNVTKSLVHVHVTDTTWAEYQILDTLTAMRMDILVLVLHEGGSINRTAKTFYDLCRLEVLK